MTVRQAGNARVYAAIPFLVVATLAIVGAGVIAAAVAHAPTQPLVWMVAYLVLVVGVAQAALGIAQSWLSLSPPSLRLLATELVVFNLANGGVIGGTLASSWPVVLAGTLLFVVALALFLYSSWKSRAGWTVHVYRLLLTILLAGATVGLVLSAVRHLH